MVGGAAGPRRPRDAPVGEGTATDPWVGTGPAWEPSRPATRVTWRPNGAAVLGGVLVVLLMLCHALLVYIGAIAAGLWLTGDASVAARPPWWVFVAASAVFAATVVPVGRWVRAGVDEVVSARPDAGYLLIGKLDAELQAMESPAASLPGAARLIATELRLPYVVVETRAPSADGRPAPGGERPGRARPARDDAPDIDVALPPPAAFGFGAPVADAPVHRLPIAYLERPMGTLVAGARTRGRPLARQDLALLAGAARQLGTALHAAALTVDLRASRERLVAAREEERRRIRNDLHDGLGPALASLQLQLGTVVRLMRERPDEAEALAQGLRTGLREATAEIRRLVHDLRPPALDVFGLVGAVRQLCEEGDSIGIAFDVQAPDPLPPLPAAVEVAAYRIASEAVHNAMRHSGASRCTVRFEMAAGELRLEVRDDGAGLPAEWPAGVGTASMRERAAEVGGTVVLGNSDGGGARLVARLPLRPAEGGAIAGGRDPWTA